MKSWATKEISDPIIKYYTDGHNQKEIAKYFQIPVSRVKYILTFYNVNLHSISEIIKKVECVRFKLPKGTPPPNKGKRYHLKHIKKYPSLCGSNNHFWRGGTNTFKHKLMHIAEYELWKRSIYERDNYTCQHCNRSKKQYDDIKLHTHHIISLKSIINDYQLQDIEGALSCNILWDISNGITLCIECHSKTESYGRKKCLPNNDRHK